MTEPLIIDGSVGEGGGQILRTSLALSSITGRPIRIVKIRAGRSNPGLGNQHLMSVEASAHVSKARVVGAALGSSELYFEPGESAAGEYEFRMDSAGSASLVLQTVLPILLCCARPSVVTIHGGTCTNMAPPVQFLQQVFCPALVAIGCGLRIEHVRQGFFPAGGGTLRAHITPPAAGAARPLAGPPWLGLRGPLLSLQMSVIATKKTPPEYVAQEVAAFAEAAATAFPGVASTSPPSVETSRAPGPGLFTSLQLVYSDGGTRVFCNAGDVRKQKPGAAAAECVREASVFEGHGPSAAVDEYLADQLLLPLVLGAGGRFLTGPLSLHTETNIGTIKLFFPEHAATTAAPASADSGAGGCMVVDVPGYQLLGKEFMSVMPAAVTEATSSAAAAPSPA